MDFFRSANSKACMRINDAAARNSKSLDLSNIGLTEIPSELANGYSFDYINLDNNKIKKLAGIPIGVKTLSVCNNILDDIYDLPSSLISLYADNNNISHLNLKHLPNINYISAHNNRVNQISYPPENLFILLISHNKLTSIKNLSSVKILNVSANELTEFDFPQNVVDVNISNNKISSLLNIPLTLKKLVCTDTIINNYKDLDPKLMFIETIGIDKKITNYYYDMYATKLQRAVRKYLIKKKLKRLILFKHIRDVGLLPHNLNYYALKAYYVNPLCKLATKGGSYDKRFNIKN